MFRKRHPFFYISSPSFTYFRREYFPIKVHFSWSHLFLDVHMSAFHTISCLQLSKPSLSPSLNLLHKIVFGFLDTNGMSKVLCYHAVMLPRSQPLCIESLNSIHITKICINYLKISSYFAFIIL